MSDNKPPADNNGLLEFLKKLWLPVAGFLGAVTLAYNFYKMWLGDQETVTFISAGAGLVVLVIVLGWVGFGYRTITRDAVWPIGEKKTEKFPAYPLSYQKFSRVVLTVVVAVLAGLLFANPLDNFSQNTTVPANTALGLTLEASTLPVGVQSTEGPITASLPTVKYPDGKRFMLFYDDNSLYLLNLSDSIVPINWIAFERLSDADVPLNRFNGTLWAEFYANSSPGRCVALQILDSPPYLDPPECGHTNFLSLRMPTRGDPTIFWTTLHGSHEFRVLWREGGPEEEIARCEIGAGTCEVLIPSSTEAPVSYELLIVRSGDGNSLIVVNLTANVFPLSLLQLGNDNDALVGAEWSIANLESEACVGAWKAGEVREPPGSLNCQLVGERLERTKNLFGGETFVVYYNGKQVGECDKNDNQCSIRFFP